jgi:hypothetical protein
MRWAYGHLTSKFIQLNQLALQQNLVSLEEQNV